MLGNVLVSYSMTAEQHFLDLISSTHKGPDGFIGSEGYSLPSLHDLARYDLAEIREGKVNNLEFEGRCGNGNAVYVPKKGLIRKAVIAASLKLENSCFVFDTDLTLSPKIAAHNSNQLAIFSGGIPTVGHGGKLVLTMFGKNQTFFWGRGSTTNGTQIQLCGDDRYIIVGDDCMFAHNIEVRTHDMHALISMSDGKQQNYPESILVEPHVWIGPQVSFGRGVTVGLGSVVGAKSYISRNIPRFCVAAGLPAKVLKTGVSWDRKSFAEDGTYLHLQEMAKAIEDRTRTSDDW